MVDAFASASLRLERRRRKSVILPLIRRLLNVVAGGLGAGGVGFGGNDAGAGAGDASDTTSSARLVAAAWERIAARSVRRRRRLLDSELPVNDDATLDSLSS